MTIKHKPQADMLIPCYEKLIYVFTLAQKVATYDLVMKWIIIIVQCYLHAGNP